MQTNATDGGADGGADMVVVRALLAAAGLAATPADVESIVARRPLVRRTSALLYAVDLPPETLPASTFTVKPA